MFARYILPYIAFFFYKTLQWSWRIRITESDAVKTMMKEGKPFVIAHWHGDELGIIHLVKPYHVACIISESKDGEIMNRVVRMLGGSTARGSSTRGGTQALKGILRLKQDGWRPSVAVDGPKGPIYKVKPGVLQISRLSKLPIVPVAFYGTQTHTFHKAWNKAQLPLPFAKIHIYWGEPFPAISKQQDPKDPNLAAQLEKHIHSTKTHVKALFDAE